MAQSTSNTVKNPFQTLKFAPSSTKAPATGGIRPATQTGVFNPKISAPKTGLMSTPTIAGGSGGGSWGGMNTQGKESNISPVQNVGTATPQNNAISSGAPAAFNTNFKQQTNTGYAPQGTPVPQSQGQTQQFQSPSNGLFPNIATSLANRSNSVDPMTSESYKKAQQLQDFLTKSKMNQAKAETMQGNAPIPIGDATGRQQNTRMQYLAEQQALSDQLGYQKDLAGLGQTQQSLGQSALNQAGGLTQPTMQFGQLTDPLTGQVIGAGQSGNNPQLDNALANAVKMVQNGASANDALSTLSGFGQAGVNAFTNAMQQVSNGTYNPTAQNTIAGANAAIGEKYQLESAALSVPLAQLNVASQQLNDFMNRAMLNQDPSVWKNKSYNALMLEAQNPQDKATMNAAMAGMRNYLSQIIAADTGLNIDAVTADVDSYDFGSMPATQIRDFMQNVITEGNTRRDALNMTSQGGYGKSTGAYTGENTPTGSQFTTGPTMTDNIATNAFYTQVVNSPQTISALIGGLFSKVF